MMRKFSIFFLLAFLLGCGPVEDPAMDYYEAIYSSTVKARNAEIAMNKEIDACINRALYGDSEPVDQNIVNAMVDTNAAISSRIEAAITYLMLAPNYGDYEPAKNEALTMLKAQAYFHKITVPNTLVELTERPGVSRNSGVLTGYQTAYTEIKEQYADWKKYRDEFTKQLGLTSDELQVYASIYGTDIAE